MTGAVLAVLFGIVLALVIFGVGVWWVGRLAARRRGGLPAATGAAGDLGTQANELLLDADDSMRDAEQEIGFIEAQFTVIEAKRLRDALAAAKDEIRVAFELRQRLDDETPDDGATRDRWLKEVAARSRKAMALIEEQRGQVETLRDVERTAPELLERVPETLAAIEARFTAVEEAFNRLKGFAPAVWEPVGGNIVEAKKRVALARAQVEAGQKALAAGDRQAAGQSGAAAEDGAAQALTLLDAVTNAERDLLATQAGLTEAMVDARSTVAAAVAAVTEGKVSGLAARLAEAQERLKAAEDFVDAAQADPIAASRQASLALAAAQEVLVGVQEEAERAAGERQALTLALDTAGRTYARSADYIQVRRDSVEAEARARLAEAQRHLELARDLAATDPGRALDNARRAEGLASAAYNAARADFTIVKSAWGTEEALSGSELLRRFAGQRGRRRSRR